VKILTIEIAIAVNQRVCETYGGAPGVRDMDRLDAAIERLYSGHIEHPHMKAAAILQSISHDHPFHDGNKRTGYALMQSLIFSSGFRLNMSEDEKYGLVMDAVAGQELDEIFMKIVTKLSPISL